MSEPMQKTIVLVSGMSGAGKTTAMQMMEDLGYHCIDNFPAQLLPQLENLIENSKDPRYSYIALSTSAQDFPHFLYALRGEGINAGVLFLDAGNAELMKRYKSTRRTHPLLMSNTVNTLEEAIALERQMFQQNRNESFTVIDTTKLSEKELRQKLEQLFAKSSMPSFTISFISFGYKNGVPLDADLMVDVRFLPNPYWVEELRRFNGNDKVVYDYVMEKEQTQEFVRRLTAFTDYAFEEYVKEGKNHFTVAIGCTGGQHRSVTITNYLYEYYKDKYRCYKEHRDI